MEIRKLDLCFLVCKVNDYSQVNMNAAYIFIGKTEEENSLICPSEKAIEALKKAGYKIIG